MRHREYYKFLELNDGTEIRYSAMKYSGVYFQCTTSDKTQLSGYKRAITCWPDCIEPMRFFDVEGYSREELDNLRTHIEKVGGTVVNMLQEEAKELEQAMAHSVRINSILLVLDAQQAYGLVAAYMKNEREVITCKVKSSLTPFGEELRFYKEDDSEVAYFSCLYRTPNIFRVSRRENTKRFYIQNNGDEVIWISVSEGKIQLQPGERKLVCKESMEG